MLFTYADQIKGGEMGGALITDGSCAKYLVQHFSRKPERRIPLERHSRIKEDNTETRLE